MRVDLLNDSLDVMLSSISYITFPLLRWNTNLCIWTHVTHDTELSIQSYTGMLAHLEVFR